MTTSDLNVSPGTVPVNVPDVPGHSQVEGRVTVDEGKAGLGKVQIVPASQSRGNHDEGVISVEQDLGLAEVHESKLAAAKSKMAELDGPERDVYETLNVLLVQDGNIQDLLTVMTNQVCHKDWPNKQVYREACHAQIGKQFYQLDNTELKLLRDRLDSKEIHALCQTLENPESILKGARYPEQTESVLRQIGEHLRMMQTVVGINPPLSPERPKSNLKEAKKEVKKFISALEKKTCRVKLSMDGETVVATHNKYFHDEQFGSAKDEIIDFFSATEVMSKVKESEKYPDLSELFSIDFKRTNIILENSDGSMELLNPVLGGEVEKQAVDRIREFCGDRKFLVSSLLGQRLHLYGTRILIHMLINADEVDKRHLPGMNGGNGTLFRLKANSDGSFEVNGEYDARVSSSASIADGCAGTDMTMMNVKNSHFNVKFQIKVDPDGELKPGRFDFDYVSVPMLGVDGLLTNNYPFVLESPVLQRKGTLAIGVAWAKKLGFAATGFLQHLQIDRQEAQALAKQMVQQPQSSKGPEDNLAQQKIADLRRDRKSPPKQVAELQTTYDTAMSKIGEINLTMKRESSLNPDPTQVLADLADLAEHGEALRSLQQDILIVLAELVQAEQKDGNLMTVYGGIFEACEEVLLGIDMLRADRQTAQVTEQGKIDAKNLGQDKEARLRMAQLQATAMRIALSEAVFKVVEISNVLGSGGVALLEEVADREQNIKTNLDNVAAGRAEPLHVGKGVGGKELENAKKQVRNQLGRQKGKLPREHSKLSEAQLMRVRVDKFIADHPETEAAFAGWELNYERALAEELSKQVGKPVTTALLNQDEHGQWRCFVSNLSPLAPNPQGGVKLPKCDNNRGMPSIVRNSVHVPNLMLSELRDSQDGILFKGLRHGTIDACDINAKAMASTSVEDRDVLVRNLTSGGNYSAHSNSGEAGAGALLKATGARAARQKANEIGARELVQAAVLADPALMEKALAGQEVEVTLDSIHLLSPEVLGPRPREASEKRMMLNQRRALNSLNAGDAVSIKIADKEGNERDVRVKAKVNMLTIGASEYRGFARLKRLVQRIVGWNRIDRLNRDALQELVGPLNGRKELGGAAGTMLRDHDEKNTPEDKARKAVVTQLGLDIKELIRSKKYRRAGGDRELASRIAMLSYLLGRTPVYDCRSGCQRTSVLDKAVKELALKIGQGQVPKLSDDPDYFLHAMISLNSGNLEVQRNNLN